MKNWKLKTLKIVPFRVAPINNKYFGVNLIKYVLALYILNEQNSDERNHIVLNK